ncbi:hypothetical protein HDV57DRAFT_48823 [Trichoderma longibrachiatum]
MGWCGAGEVAHCEYSNGANSVLFQSSPLYRAMTLMPALAAGSHLLIPCELRRALFLTITQASRYHGRAFVLSRMRLHADTLAASAPPCQMENERAEVIAPMQASARQWQNADRRLGKWLVGGLEERCGLNFVSPVRELGQSPVESNCPLKRTATGRKQERLLGSRWCIAYLHARRRRQCHASARYFRGLTSDTAKAQALSLSPATRLFDRYPQIRSSDLREPALSPCSRKALILFV